MEDIALRLTQELADLFAALPQVEAVALGGSRGSVSNAADTASDIDLYVYTRAEVPLAARQAIVAQTGDASRADLGQNYWGPSDGWYHAPSGIEVDIVYFDAAWMEEQIHRVLVEYRPGMGYTTCFCYTLAQSRVYHDPGGWFAALQARCAAPYPEELRRNIITLNHPLLRGIISSYEHQVHKAVRRGDLVSINHRLAALLASYFDILFAINRQYHPGEKRLVQYAVQHCARLPRNFDADIHSALNSAACNAEHLPGVITRMLDALDELLIREEFTLNPINSNGSGGIANP